MLHDGPPYANGDLHMGHAVNKVFYIYIKYLFNITNLLILDPERHHTEKQNNKSAEGPLLTRMGLPRSANRA